MYLKIKSINSEYNKKGIPISQNRHIFHTNWVELIILMSNMFFTSMLNS